MSRRELLHRHWLKFTGPLEDARCRFLVAVMKRVATDEIRHAALLLGYDTGAGYGTSAGLLSYLGEWTVGNELQGEIEHGSPPEAARAREQFALERSLFGQNRRHGWVAPL